MRAGTSTERVACADRLGHADQQLVARRVAERVVHALQAVDVEQQQRERVAVALLKPEQVVDLLPEVAEVEEAGQRVRVGEPLELARALAQELLDAVPTGSARTA